MCIARRKKNQPKVQYRTSGWFYNGAVTLDAANDYLESHRIELTLYNAAGK
jgi:hypothetical protein